MSYQKLFDWFSENYDVLLVESEMHEVVSICKDIAKEEEQIQCYPVDEKYPIAVLTNQYKSMIPIVSVMSEDSEMYSKMRMRQSALLNAIGILKRETNKS